MHTENYITQAQRTSAPIDPDMVARACNAGTLSDLAYLTSKMIEISSQLDLIKKNIFYGKPFVGGASDEPIMSLDKIRARLCNETNIKLLHSALGIATEAGEYLESVMAHIIGGKPLDGINVVEELGDNQWYVAEGCAAVKATLEDVQEVNIAKLKKRYPEKFNQELAINRNLKAERKILEGK